MFHLEACFKTGFWSSFIGVNLQLFQQNSHQSRKIWVTIKQFIFMKKSNNSYLKDQTECIYLLLFQSKLFALLLAKDYIFFLDSCNLTSNSTLTCSKQQNGHRQLLSNCGGQLLLGLSVGPQEILKTTKLKSGKWRVLDEQRHLQQDGALC